MKNRMNESQRRGIIESCLVSGAYRKSGPEWLSFLHSLAFLSLFRFFSHFSFFSHTLSFSLSLPNSCKKFSIFFLFLHTHVYVIYSNFIKINNKKSCQFRNKFVLTALFTFPRHDEADLIL